MRVDRAASLHQDAASQALHLSRGRPRALGDLNGRPYRGARVTERLSPLLPRSQLVRGLRLQPSRGGKLTAPHTLGDARRQPASARHRDRSHHRPAAEARRCARSRRPGAHSPVHRRAGQSAGSGTGAAHGEAERKWRPGLHGNRRALPSAGLRSASPSATAQAPAKRACAVRAGEAFALSCPARAGS